MFCYVEFEELGERDNEAADASGIMVSEEVALFVFLRVTSVLSRTVQKCIIAKAAYCRPSLQDIDTT